MKMLCLQTAWLDGIVNGLVLWELKWSANNHYFFCRDVNSGAHACYTCLSLKQTPVAHLSCRVPWLPHTLHWTTQSQVPNWSLLKPLSWPRGGLRSSHLPLCDMGMQGNSPAPQVIDSAQTPLVFPEAQESVTPPRSPSGPSAFRKISSCSPHGCLFCCCDVLFLNEQRVYLKRNLCRCRQEDEPAVIFLQNTSTCKWQCLRQVGISATQT